MTNALYAWSAGVLLVVGLAGCQPDNSPGTADSDDAVAPVADESKTEQPDTAVPKNTTAGWNTYTNDTVGYSLRYPAGWKIDEDGGKSNVIIRSAKASNFGQITIGVEADSWSKLREGFINDYKAQENKTTFAGKPAYRFVFPEQTGSPTLAASKVFIPFGESVTYVIVGSFEPEITQQVAATIRFQ